MRIYKKCPCCGKTMFLMLGSDFNNEVELGSAFGSKDNIPHLDANHEQDYQCLNNFLACLANSHGEVFISLSEKEENKLPKDKKELILKWKEGYKKAEEEPVDNPQTDNQGGGNYRFPGDNSVPDTAPSDNKDWVNIHRDFAEGDYKERWIRNGFNYEQTREWINIGMGILDCYFCAWLRDFKRMTPEQVLNYGDVSTLRREWEDTLTHDG